MVMFAADRHAEIVATLDASGRVVSTDVAARLGVSIDTVRRDLAELETLGALKRVHGGAVRPVPGPRRFAERLASDDVPKETVAALAAGLVPRAGLVALAGGTTVLLLAQRLPRDLEATVVTTSPDVAVALAAVHRGSGSPRRPLHRDSQTVTCAYTVVQLQSLHPDARAAECGGRRSRRRRDVPLRRDGSPVVRAMIQALRAHADRWSLLDKKLALGEPGRAGRAHLRASTSSSHLTSRARA